MRDKTGEVWEATHLGVGGGVFAVMSSNFEHRMHRCLVLELALDPWSRWSVGEVVNMGDWDDRNELWRRVA